MSTPHGPERRAQRLRRGGAAGPHDDRPTRSEAERAALADQDDEDDEDDEDACRSEGGDVG